MQSSEPEAHDKVLDNNQCELKFGNVVFGGNKLNPLMTPSPGI